MLLWMLPWRGSVANGTLRVMAELPSGTVTFLFTDLEGSTRLWEEQPETAMSDALARHDAICMRPSTVIVGVVYSEMGDGMAAVFASAPTALPRRSTRSVALASESLGRDRTVASAHGVAFGRGQFSVHRANT